MVHIRDVTNSGSLSDVASKVKEYTTLFASLVANVKERAGESPRTFVLFNIAVSCGLQLEHLERWVHRTNDLVALCARNLFELSLILRWVLSSEDNLAAWRGQAAYDEAEVFESFLKLKSDAGKETYQAVGTRVRECKEWAISNGLPPMPFKRVDLMAQQINALDEYEVFYRLYSKFVHPSSLLLNGDRNTVQNPVIFNILVSQAQLYAASCYDLLRKELRDNKKETTT